MEVILQLRVQESIEVNIQFSKPEPGVTMDLSCKLQDKDKMLKISLQRSLNLMSHFTWSTSVLNKFHLNLRCNIFIL